MVHCAVTTVAFDESCIDSLMAREGLDDLKLSPSTSENPIAELPAAIIEDESKTTSHQSIFRAEYTTRSRGCGVDSVPLDGLRTLNAIIDAISAPLACNYYMMTTSVANLCSVGDLGLGLEMQLVHARCSLEDGRGQLLEDLAESTSLVAVREILIAAIAVCNAQTARVWTQLVAIMPRAMTALALTMRYNHDAVIRRFWSQQVLVHTCR